MSHLSTKTIHIHIRNAHIPFPFVFKQQLQCLTNNNNYSESLLHETTTYGNLLLTATYTAGK